MIVNGEYASWASLRVKIQRDSFLYLTEDVTEIEFEDSVDGEKIRGNGRRPRGFTVGDYDSNASMTMYLDSAIDFMNQLAALDAQSRLTYVKFDLLLRWATEDAPERRAILPGARIVGRSVSQSQGSAEGTTLPMPLMVTKPIEIDGVKLV